MTNNKSKGNLGEAIACEYLVNKGYTILHTNWRHKYWEVDIIALRNKTLHFVEVKTRTNLNFGLPEESISEKKMNALKRAAIAYTEQNGNYSLLQFDVVSIILDKQKAKEIFLIEDVFF